MTKKTVTVYLGSSGRCRSIFKESAENLGHIIGEHGMNLVYGGMNAGLMGIVAENAKASGARVTGVVPQKIDDSKRILKGLDETILVQDLWERKLKMFNMADAIIALPGGFGTLDEMMEALYWQGIEHHDKPVILVNTDGYWDTFLSYAAHLSDLPREIFHVVENEADAITLIANMSLGGPSPSYAALPHFEGEILTDSSEPLVFEDATVAQSYKLATALGLKQLAKHNRHMGVLNNNGQFTDLIRWIDIAQKEHFITDHCTALFSVAEDMNTLSEKMDNQKKISIDLDREKWGPSQTGQHLEINEMPDPE